MPEELFRTIGAELRTVFRTAGVYVRVTGAEERRTTGVYVRATGVVVCRTTGAETRRTVRVTPLPVRVVVETA